MLFAAMVTMKLTTVSGAAVAGLNEAEIPAAVGLVDVSGDFSQPQGIRAASRMATAGNNFRNGMALSIDITVLYREPGSINSPLPT